MTIGFEAGVPGTYGLGTIRHDWTREEVRALFALPFPELMFEAQRIHRLHFDPREVQISTLLSIKTGGCPEDCAYCPQSVHYDTGVGAAKLMDLADVLAQARAAQAAGASRFCMGAAWRSPKDRDLEHVCAMVTGVKALGLETCATLGMLTAPQARRLKDAGLDYYNHNIDTSPEYYGEIITTRTYRDRLDTLGHVRDAGIHVCCGGIVGMGEAREDRVGMIATLASLPVHPERADQHARAGRRHAGGGARGDRAARVRAHHRGRTHHHAGLGGAALGGPRGHERGDPGDVLPGRGKLDLLRAEAAHHAQSGAGLRPPSARPPRHGADGVVTTTARRQRTPGR
jgi:biotin synthase